MIVPPGAILVIAQGNCESSSVRGGGEGASTYPFQDTFHLPIPSRSDIWIRAPASGEPGSRLEKVTRRVAAVALRPSGNPLRVRSTSIFQAFRRVDVGLRACYTVRGSDAVSHPSRRIC